jgi:integrase
MGLYRRTWRRRDGKRITTKMWWMTAMIDGRQVCLSTGTRNRRLGQQRQDAWRTEIAQGQYSLLRKAPQLEHWAEKYLESVEHPNTRRRYKSSSANLLTFFGDSRLDHISTTRIEGFKRARRADQVKAATINRDLRFLAQILKQAERERYIGRSPFDLGKFFANETRDRRTPHILSYEEQEKLLAVSPPRIRALTVLGVESGMRTGEMTGLRWEDIDFLNGVLRVVKSKSTAGIRSVPLSEFAKTELLKWRSLVGPEFSEWVFPSFSNRRHPLQGGRKAWASALRRAGIPFFFPIYNLRHTFASRMTAVGVSPITIAQMLGHASTQIVPRYAQVLDQNRFDAMKRLEVLRQLSISTGSVSAADQSPDQSNKEIDHSKAES